MADLKYDDQHDIELSPTTKDIETVDDDLKQGIVIFLNVNLGELPWNPDFGIDMWQVLMDIHDESALSAELDEWVTDYFDEVDSVTVDSVTYQKRVATINLTVVLKDSDDLTIEMEVADDGIIDG